ncbi:MAG: hypothetical protein IJU42_00965 [Erysipelotrichaceae bacterium]|nr:hypothetical protein [Erysipelotrichaceae bacterium]
MKKSSRNLYLEKLKGGLDQEDQDRIDVFFHELSDQIDMPILSRDLLVHHFVDAFSYYLEQGKSTEEICELMDYRFLGDFYQGDHRRSFSLDNAAIVYPLGMKYGQMPMFRMAAELKEDVQPVLLQLAVDFTIKRFPSFSAVTKNGFFWHYLETVNHVSLIEEEKDIPCKPISILLRGFRSFRVLYCGKRISVEVFHAITDGSGAMVFLKTLVKEYLRLKEIDAKDDPEIPDINSPVDERELVNEFNEAKENASLSTFVDKRSIQLKGKISRLNLTKITHFEMDAGRLHDTARSYGGTITAYLLALLLIASKDCVNQKEGVFNVQVPVNMRKFNGSRTLRNYSMYFNVTEDLSKLPDKKELVGDVSRQIAEKGSEKMMNQMMMTTKKVIRSLCLVPLFLKIPLMQLVYAYLGNSIIAFTFSNLGVVKLPEGMKEAVRKLYFVFVPGPPNRIATSLVTANGISVFSIMRNSNDPTFEQRMYELLEEDGLIENTEGSVEYES